MQDQSKIILLRDFEICTFKKWPQEKSHLILLI